MTNIEKINSNDLALKISSTDMGVLLKPLVKEIHLFNTYIAGTTHIEDQKNLANLKIGDKLILLRENNKLDDKAIQVLTSKKEKVGYIPQIDNIIFSRLMDAGKLLIAKIKEKEKIKKWYKISIEIFLVDF